MIARVLLAAAFSIGLSLSAVADDVPDLGIGYAEFMCHDAIVMKTVAAALEGGLSDDDAELLGNALVARGVCAYFNSPYPLKWAERIEGSEAGGVAGLEVWRVLPANGETAAPWFALRRTSPRA